MSMDAMEHDLDELERAAKRMEELGPGDLDEASALLARAALLRNRLEAPLTALERLATLVGGQDIS